MAARSPASFELNVFVWPLAIRTLALMEIYSLRLDSPTGT